MSQEILHLHPISTPVLVLSLISYSFNARFRVNDIFQHYTVKFQRTDLNVDLLIPERGNDNLEFLTLGVSRNSRAHTPRWHTPPTPKALKNSGSY